MARGQVLRTWSASWSRCPHIRLSARRSVKPYSRSWSSTARQLMIPRGAAAVQHRQFACRLVRQAPNWCLQFSRMGDLVRNGAPQRSLRDRNRGKTPAHARGMTTSLTLGFPAAGGHQQPTVFSRLTELAGSWDQLAVGSGSPTHHYAWVSAYADIASTSSDLHLVVVGPPQRPVAIAPLIMRRRGGGRLEQLGVRELHEPMDLIYRSAADLTALAEAMAQLGLPLWLERVPAESSDRKSTRLNSSHTVISYAVFCLKKKTKTH